MVKKLSAADKSLIVQVVTQAEQATSAELAVVIAHTSDAYQATALSCGLVLGTLVALLLWHLHVVVGFPALLLVQLFITALVRMTPPLAEQCIRLVPKRILHQRAARASAAEYLHLARHLPAGVPVVMLYVSLSERYVHIHTSRSVREAIGTAEWNAVVARLTSAVKKVGVTNAILEAIAHAGAILSAVFPPAGRVHGAAHVTEV